MFVGGALFGLMNRLRRRRRGAPALLRRCVEYHAVEYHGLLCFGMNGRNAYSQDKSRNCQELHQSTPISMDMYFAGSSRRTARKVVVKLRGQSINAVCQQRNSGAGESNITSGDARSAGVKSDVVAIVL
jgi:VCBS repeat-containing protein